MGSGVVCLWEDEYVEWSTVVDAPTTYIMSRSEAVAEYGEDRVARADRQWTSFIAPRYTLADLLEGNRAGPGERLASLDEIRRLFRLPEDES